MVSLKTHNILDYVAGVVLMLCPVLFSFADVAAPRNVFLLTGAVLIAYSLLTNYYYSVVKWIPVRVHMMLDVAAGVFVIAAPWLLSYSYELTNAGWALHWIAGLAPVALVGVTRNRTQDVTIKVGTHHVRTAH